jgi:hypothetical protein
VQRLLGGAPALSGPPRSGLDYGAALRRPANVRAAACFARQPLPAATRARPSPCPTVQVPGGLLPPQHLPLRHGVPLHPQRGKLPAEPRQRQSQALGATDNCAARRPPAFDCLPRRCSCSLPPLPRSGHRPQRGTKTRVRQRRSLQAPANARLRAAAAFHSNSQDEGWKPSITVKQILLGIQVRARRPLPPAGRARPAPPHMNPPSWLAPHRAFHVPTHLPARLPAPTRRPLPLYHPPRRSSWTTPTLAAPHRATPLSSTRSG